VYNIKKDVPKRFSARWRKPKSINVRLNLMHVKPKGMRVRLNLKYVGLKLRSVIVKCKMS